MPDILVSCDSLAKAHGARPLFSGVSFGIEEGERVGLVGPNGAGKSTLLRMLSGQDSPDSGSVVRRRMLRTGFVEQTPEIDPSQTCEQAIVAAMPGVDEHEAHVRAAVALGRAGFADSTALAGSLSGGWRKRLAIARELAKEPDLLLLDEPTNHLDIEGIEWLEDLLVSQRMTFMVASHDRAFLQAVSSRMIELDRAWPGGLFSVRGRYADFLEKREEAFAGQLAAQQSLKNVVKREIEWLRRGPKARTTKSQARIDEANRLQKELAASKERTRVESAGIDFTASGRRSKRLLHAHGVTKSMGERRVIDRLELTLVNGMRLGVLGSNGSGKTTLLRLLTGELEPDAGTIERAPGLRVVRFEQDRASLDPAQPLMRALGGEGDMVTFRGEAVHVSSWARRFLFRPEQLQVSVSRLSGGEQARLLIARLMLRPADVLLLDEPTNDLDIPTLEVLEESLAEFPGALVLVTHDRFMLDRTCTSLLAIESDGSLTAHADLAQWEASRVAAPAAAKAEASSASSAKARSPSAGKKALSWTERQEWESMESRIEAAEARLQACREASEDPSIARDAAKLHARHVEQEAAQDAVDKLYARWAELERKRQ